MKLVIITGAGAAGKMTVGQELTKITKLKLFHNHMSIEPVLEIFGQYNKNAVEGIRNVIFEEFAKTNNDGLIFTYIMAFDCIEDWDYLRYVTEIFDNADIYFIELVCSQNIRLQRNKSQNRLDNKPSKQDVEFSQRLIIEYDNRYRLESFESEIPFENYMKIDNSNLSAQKCAEIIKNRFNL